MLLVEHGHSCTPRASGGIHVHEMAPFPAFADSGTIIFNGSLMGYPDGDQHVEMLGSGAIVNIEKRAGSGGSELHWDAAGSLADNGDAPFEWCYTFTLVFWRSGRSGFAAAVPETIARIHGEYNTDGNEAFYASSLNIPGGPRALLPRGNALWYSAGDQHLLQAGYELGTPTISGNTISWTSTGLLKDDDGDEQFSSAETVAVMTGPSVSFLEPQTVYHWIRAPRAGAWRSEAVNFEFQPHAGEGGPFCVDSASSNRFAGGDYAVSVPFSYAVPMLTGWQVDGGCHDHHVAQVGTYIDHFSFVPDSSGTRGTLYYTIESSFTDDDGGWNNPQYKVTILGLTPESIVTNPILNLGGGTLSP
jgi:hypothetical protein